MLDRIYLNLSSNILLHACMFFPFLVKPTSTILRSVPEIAIITKSVKIICKAEGLPEPTYVIYHNGAKLTDKGEITINPKCSHAGEYRCNATNKLGMDSQTYFLKVKGEICGNHFISTSLNLRLLANVVFLNDRF